MQIGPSNEGYNYVLVIKDDFSGFIDVIPCETPDAEVVIKSLLRWYSLLGISLVHISDQGSHFKNKVIAELNRRLATKHHFTLPYTPWSNGTIEVVNRELRKLLRTWISEFRIPLKDWPSLIPLMVHVLNFSVSPRLGFPPALVFGGFTTQHNLDFIFSSTNKFLNSRANFETISNQVSELRNSLDLLHKKINEKDRVPKRGNQKNVSNLLSASSFIFNRFVINISSSTTTTTKIRFYFFSVKSGSIQRFLF
jgi:transposase InsO family protein